VAALAQAEALERTRAEETERLRYGLERVDAVAPAADEDRALAVEIERLDHAEQLREAAAHALARLSADVSTGEDATSAGALLADAHRELGVAASHDPVLADLDGRLDEIGYLVADLASELAGYVEAIDTDPARLAALQERRAALGALVRLHGPDLDGVLAWAAAARGRLGELEGNEDRLAALAEEATALRGKLEELAAVVTDGRMLAAERFGATVSVELAALAMPSAHVTAEVRPTPELGPDGRDEVELLLRPHPGAQSRPLARGASGGELSRVMLAVEVVFARADDTATLIFDEVDAGVGGKAAVEVGRRLARLARDHQVVVVTHLPQVAAFADRHLLVEKSDDGSVTETGVVHLEGPARVAELSRMLAGLDASERALAHAEELLAVAEEAKRA
jgi:DNA repair protein RecN (Recombination protein N)